MPVILDSSEIKVIDGDKNFTIETVKSNVIVNQDTVINEPVVPILQLETTVSSETIDETYKYMSFTHSGGSEDQTEYSVKFNIETECDILIVGGGGAGGNNHGGGGGGGAVIYCQNKEIPNGNYTIKVGNGGNTNRENGQPTEAFNVIADGGGGGGYYNGVAGNHGGCGGGAPYNSSSSGNSTITDNSSTDLFSSWGGTNNIYGGDGNNGSVASGGGGGGAGGSSTSVKTNGNDGIQINIDGNNYYWAGGGGGYSEASSGSPFGGNGGLGGGGGAGHYNNPEVNDGVGGTGGINLGGDGGEDGHNANTIGGNGGDHTGSGGGAGHSGHFGSGGSGIVIIRYKVVDVMEPQTLTHYTPERMYPPIHNFTSYSHLISGESYGNGVYEVSVSTNSGSQEGFKSFNDISTDIGWSGEGNEYSSTGMYIQSNYIVPGYLGDWIKIKLPRPIKLTKYGFKQRAGPYEVRAPGKYKIYGSNDGTNWDVLVHKRSKISYTQQISESNDYFEENINVNNQYQYFALVVNELMGSVILVNFHLWYIYGKEFISEEPEYKTLTFEYQPTDLIFTFREDESPYSWQEAYDEAIANGKRMPTKTELLDYLSVSGTLYPGQDIWCPVVAPEYSNGKDWIQIGNSSHFTGKSHTGDLGTYPSWGGSTTGNMARIYCEVIEYNQTEYTVNFPENTTCDILIVGGGGGGGTYLGGGGGAGGVVYTVNQTLNGTYTICIGKGGIGRSLNTDDGSDAFKGGNGINSFIKNSDGSYVNMNMGGTSHNLIGLGGGGGGTYGPNSSYIGNDGGSGGGGAEKDHTGAIGGSGIQPNTLYNAETQAYIAGGSDGSASDNSSIYFGGGGGGAGNTTNSYKNGKSGILIDITGTNQYYAAGGGGGQFMYSHFTGNNVIDISVGIGGSEIGGNGRIWNGSTYIREATSGKNGTGSGGGGGAANQDPDNPSGNGGSGIVIIRYKTQYQATTHGAQWTYHSTNPNTHHYGNVGIGTVASATQKLLVNGDMNVTGNYKLNDNTIGNWYTNGTDVYRTSGNVGIGTTIPQYSLHVEGGIYAGQGGTTGDGTTTWTVTSDNRMKDNIFKASYKECYEIFKKIELYRYNFKPGYVNSNDRNQLGFIAQEVQQQLPRSVEPRSIRLSSGVYIHDILTLNVTQINYILYGTFKYLMAELDIIKKHLESQEEA